jgi:hypothetical protein
MPVFAHHDSTDCFDPEQIEMMQRVIDRAWDVVRHDENAEKETEARSLLSLCVLNEARRGEDSYTRLVNRSIVAFRRQSALLLPARRSA